MRRFRQQAGSDASAALGKIIFTSRPADMWQGGVSLNWGLCLAGGTWLILTRLTLGTDGALVNADHLIGALR